MTKSKFNGNREGLGFYELLVAPESVYRKAIKALQSDNFKKFYKILAIKQNTQLSGGIR